MNPRTLLPIALVAGFLVTLAGSAQQNVPSGAKVLLLSGGQRNHHGYRRQAQLLQKALEDTKQFQATICEDAAILETPALQKYDLIVATADRRDPEFRLTETQQRALLKFVHDGKGFFALHGFCCADRMWVPEMRELLGGVLAHFGTPDTKVQSGKFLLKILDPSHPAVRGLTDFEHEDELYYHLQTHGELHPLAVASFEGMDWPVLWTRMYGLGKVCVSVFGHCGVQPGAKDPLEHEPFRRLILQGIAWSAGRELPAKDRP
ncbi:MAG TPA: ThuA domain-containing protein [Gemmataceae bacterium]|nr:ThuA domain-containing protein [Gemmataceae bacterium]